MVDYSSSARVELEGVDAVGIRADNPGPFTLSGTNSWIVSSMPAWVVDPGPDLAEHVDAVASEVARRGGLGGIALTHDHSDHSQAVAPLRERFPDAPLAGGRGAVDVLLADGARFGPLEAVATPGHAPDHFAFVNADVAFTGDAVLGQGSVFIAPDPDALAGYLEGLAKLRRRPLKLLCPGHGPPVSGAGGEAGRVRGPSTRSRAPACGGVSRPAPARWMRCSTQPGMTSPPTCGRPRR